MKRTIVLAIVMSLVLPALAAAKVVINHSMFGITLGSSQTQVRAKLGKPDNVVHVTGTAEWVYTRKRAVVMFSGRRPVVTGLYTESQAERTATGLGVGSTRQQVERAIPGVSCTAHGCVALAQRGHKTYATDFALDHSGRVTSILVNQLG